MASRDTAQLILQVDAQIASAQRSLNSLARSVNQDAASMEKSLDKVAASHARIGKALNDNGRIRSGLTQLSFQIGDVTQQMSLGVRASTIFAQQSGQVIQALQGMGGEGNKFLRFLGGPWGIAISTAAVILGSLIPKLLDGKDAVSDLVDKMREQAEQARNNKEANDIWRTSIEGVTESIEKQAEELDKKQATPRSELQDSLNTAKQNQAIAEEQLRRLIETRKKVKAEIDGFKSVINSAVSEESVNAASQLLTKAEDRLANLEKLIAGRRGAIAKAAADARGFESELGKLDVEAKLDPVVAATQALEEAERKLDQQRRAGIITQKEYNEQLLAAKKHLEDVKKAAQDANKNGIASFKASVIGAEGTGPNRLGSSAAGFGQFMPQTWLSYFDKLFPDKATLDRSAKLEFRNVREVAVAVIDKATDDYVSVLKSAGQQITAANLYAVHLLGARDAKKLFAASPNAPTSSFLSAAVLKGNPFLAGTAASARAEIGKRIGDSSSSVSSGAAAIQRAIEEQAKRDLAEQNAFEEQRDRLNESLLSAQRDLLQGTNEQADAAEEAVRVEQSRRDAAIQNDAEEGKITQAHAEELKAINASVAAEKIKAIEIDRQVKLLQQQDERQQRTFQYQIDDLRFADEQARSQAEHRRLQLDILDIVYQQKEAHLKALKAELELAGKIEEAADVQTQIDRLPAEKAHDQASTVRNTQGPLESYFSQVPQTADEVNEAMQRLEVQGIDGAINSIIALTDGFDSFRDTALSAIKAVIAELIRMQLMKLAMNIIGGAAGAPGAGGAANIVTSAGASSFLAGGGFLPGFASGGIVTVGGRGGVDQNVVSINGVPRFRASGDERLAIIPRMPNVSFPRAANSNTPAGDTYHVNVSVPGAMSERQARKTGMQVAAGFQMELARSRAKGIG